MTCQSYGLSTCCCHGASKCTKLNTQPHPHYRFEKLYILGTYNTSLILILLMQPLGIVSTKMELLPMSWSTILLAMNTFLFWMVSKESKSNKQGNIYVILSQSMIQSNTMLVWISCEAMKDWSSTSSLVFALCFKSWLLLFSFPTIASTMTLCATIEIKGWFTLCLDALSFILVMYNWCCTKATSLCSFFSEIYTIYKPKASSFMGLLVSNATIKLSNDRGN